MPLCKSMSYQQSRPSTSSAAQNLTTPHHFLSSCRPPLSNQGNNAYYWAQQLHSNPQNAQLPPMSQPPPFSNQKILPPNPYPPVHRIPQNQSAYFPPPPPPVQQNFAFFGSNQIASAIPQHISNESQPLFPPNLSFDRPPPPVLNTFIQPPPPINASYQAKASKSGSLVSAMTDSFQGQKPVKEKISGSKRLENWLQLRKKHLKPQLKGTCEESKSSVKVWDFVTKLQEMQDLIHSLSTQITGLVSAASQTDEIMWEAAKEACFSSKEKLSNEYGWLMEDQSIQHMKEKLKQTHNKRARIKRARKTKYDEAQLLQQQWNEKSKNVDRWQERLRLKTQKENKEKKQKAAADRTLSKVTKEIQDATRLIDTMLGLEKLRLIRRDAAQKRGDSDIGESRQSFEDKIKDMTRLVKAQLECYKEEESKLKHILKSEEEEKTKLEFKSQEEKARRKKKEEESKLRLILFGPVETQSPGSPLYPFSQYYKQARHNLTAFLQIRQEWDAYLVPKGTPASSCIPSTWVLPEPPSSLPWSAVLQ